MTTYRDAGVDIDAQDRALAQVKKMVRKTYTDGCCRIRAPLAGCSGCR